MSESLPDRKGQIGYVNEWRVDCKPTKVAIGDINQEGSGYLCYDESGRLVSNYCKIYTSLDEYYKSHLDFYRGLKTMQEEIAAEALSYARQIETAIKIILDNIKVRGSHEPNE